MSTPTFPTDSTNTEFVVCPSCRRSNLTGGVRCAYCGTYLPAALDFNMTSPEATDQTSPSVGTGAGKVRAGTVGAVGTLGFLALKLKTLITLFNVGKILTTLGTMAVFIWARGLFFGWKFGVGLAVCILIHEMGHVFVNWRKGIQQSAPMFIPFLGAVILVKKFPDNPAIEADSGAGGPVAGGLAAIGCLAIGYATGDPFFFALAQIGFLINLFNLIPFPPLDGSHMGAVFSPKAWWGFVTLLVLWALKVSSPILWVIVLATLLIRLGQPGDGRYLLASPRARARMLAIYTLLCIGLSWGAMHSYQVQDKTTLQSATSAPANTTPNTNQTAVGLPDTTASTRPPVSRNSAVLWVRWVVLLVLILFCWWGAVAQVGRITGLGWTKTATRLFLSIIAGYVGLSVLVAVSPFLAGAGSSSLIGAYFAAAALALMWGLVQASLVRRQARRPKPALVRLQMLGASALGALLVAYATSNPYLSVLFLATVGVFFAQNRAAWWLTLAFVASFLGDENRADAFARRAETHADPELASALRLRQVSRLLVNHHGDAALPLLAQEAQTAIVDDAVQAAAQMTDYDQQSSALSQAGQFADSLGALERLLQTAQVSPRLILSALWITHLHLADLALRRGWWDEVTAQTDWLAAHVGRVPAIAALIAQLRAMTKAAQFAGGMASADAVDAACNRALAVSHDATGRALVACALCYKFLVQGNRDAARVQAAKAVQLRPASLLSLYWNARVEGREALQEFAAQYASNYWGQQARAEIDGTNPVFAVPSLIRG